MSKLFIKQSKQYAETRPCYPKELFEYISSKTPCHDLAWALPGIFKKVIATDTSQKQLELAPKLPNIRYEHTPPPVMSIAEVEQKLTPNSNVHLVIIAQALHWFDLPNFYQQVKHVLKKPNGTLFDRFYTVDTDRYWDPARKLVDDKFKSIDFPFEPVDREENTRPFEFVREQLMDLDGFFTYIRSWSAYQTAKGKGVELLSDHVIEAFKQAWNEGGDHGQKQGWI
ncbi:methyltransferase [Pyrus ussuriensis x Pyrus communis]|uniref:Methyltransferase n=1 Tax=Pyrus ussuriensis x Pyrus communis TaxID=2448454 RepID=A0A5N5FZ25_9ROSA|nr:methyltransferase [Pyrus ussuriensis x Pyrus communis]